MSEPRRAELAGLAAVAVSALAFGTLGIFGKLASREGMSIPTLLGLRFGLAAVMLWALAAWRRQAAWPGGRRAAAVAAMGLLYVAQASAYFTSLRTIPAAVTSILLYVYPVIVTLMARLILQEALTRARLVALALACAGVVLVVNPSPAGHLDTTGVVLGLVSAVVYSTYIVAGGAVLSGVPALFATAVICTVAGVGFLGAGAVSGTLHPPGVRGWGIIAGIAVIPTLVAATLFLVGLARVGPTRAAIVSTLEPATTAVLAAAVLGEDLGAVTIVGGVVVLVAAVVVARTGGRRAAEVGATAIVRE